MYLNRAGPRFKIQYHEQTTHTDELPNEHSQLHDLGITEFTVEPLKKRIVNAVVIQGQLFCEFDGKIFPAGIVVVILIQLSNLGFRQVCFFFCTRQKSGIESGKAIVKPSDF